MHSSVPVHAYVSSKGWRARLGGKRGANPIASSSGPFSSSERSGHMLAEVDETAQVLAQYGTPEKQRQYALWGADRARRCAYETAYAQFMAGGSREAFDRANAAGHAAWAERCAAIKAEFALAGS
jgi:hypothetical protein